MSKKSLPKDVIDKWPEILNDVDVKAVPLEYLDSMRIIFTDGKVWDFTVKETTSDVLDELETQLEELINNYEDVIEHIDFRLDIDRVRADVTSQTKNFLKRSRK